MRVLMLVPYYIAWHYTRAIKNFVNIWMNLISLVFSFFSVSILFKTLFAPFQKLSEKYEGGLDIEAFFSTIIVNLLMRIVGFLMRSVLIVIGLISTIAMIIFGFGAFILWLIAPILIPFLFFAGLITILKI